MSKRYIFAYLKKNTDCELNNPSFTPMRYYGAVILWCLCLLAMTSPVSPRGNGHIQSFDNDWLFIHYGLPPDGTGKEEPKERENLTFDLAVQLNTGKI